MQSTSNVVNNHLIQYIIPVSACTESSLSQVKSMSYTEAGPRPLPTLSKIYSTVNQTQINSEEVILHFRLQVGELDMNKQNPLTTKIYPDVSDVS